MFTIFYGPTEKCKALYSVNCILVSIVNFIYLLCSMCWTGSELAQSLSAADLDYGLNSTNPLTLERQFLKIKLFFPASTRVMVDKSQLSAEWKIYFANTWHNYQQVPSLMILPNILHQEKKLPWPNFPTVSRALSTPPGKRDRILTPIFFFPLKIHHCREACRN